MDNVIEVEFKKQERSSTALLFVNPKVYADARVYAYYLYDLVQEINSHFWNNYQTANTELQQHQANEFDNYVKSVKYNIDTALNYLYNEQNNDAAYKMLKFEYDVNIKSLIAWFKTVGIEYRQANVIDIGNFIGMRQ